VYRGRGYEIWPDMSGAQKGGSGVGGRIDVANRIGTNEGLAMLRSNACASRCRLTLFLVADTMPNASGDRVMTYIFAHKFKAFPLWLIVAELVLYLAVAAAFLATG